MGRVTDQCRPKADLLSFLQSLRSRGFIRVQAPDQVLRPLQGVSSTDDISDYGLFHRKHTVSAAGTSFRRLDLRLGQARRSQ
jgi:hypothetical protein